MYRVEINFGHCRQDGRPLPAHAIAGAEEQALRALSRAFRGAQLQHHSGGYLTAGGRLMVEPCTVVWAYAPEVDGHVTLLWALAGEIAARLEQESVLLTIVQVNGTVHWVEPTQPFAVAVERSQPANVVLNGHPEIRHDEYR